MLERGPSGARLGIVWLLVARGKKGRHLGTASGGGGGPTLDKYLSLPEMKSIKFFYSSGESSRNQLCQE